MTTTNTNEKKMTKKDYFNMLLEIEAVRDSSELTNFCLHEIGLLEKKNSAERKPTKKQVENDGLIDEIANILLNASGDVMNIAEIKEESEKLQDCTPQRLSALLKKLVDAGKVERVKDKKGKTMYKAI